MNVLLIDRLHFISCVTVKKLIQGHLIQMQEFQGPHVLTNNHDLDPEEIAERIRQQQQESEKDAQWLMTEERNLVSRLMCS